VSFTAPIEGLPRIGTRMAPKIEELRKPRVRGEQSIHRREYKNMDKTAAYNLGMELALQMCGLTKLGRAGVIRAGAKVVAKRGAKGAAKRGAKRGAKHIAKGAPPKKPHAPKTPAPAATPAETAPKTPAPAATPAETAPKKWSPLATAAGIGGVGLLGYGAGSMGSQPAQQQVYGSQPMPTPFPTPYPHF